MAEAGQAQYKQLAAQLREQIDAGEYRPGDRLPTNVELAETTGLTRVTVQQAIKLLKAEGVVETRRGGGTVVAQPRAGLAATLLERAGGQPQACLFYGLPADDVVKELLDAEAHGVRLPTELVALTPTGSKDTAAGPEIDLSALPSRPGVMGFVSAPKHSTSDPRRLMRARLEVHQVKAVPGYRIGVVDYGLDEHKRRQDPAAVLYVYDPSASRLRAVPSGGLRGSETRSAMRWLTDQVKAARRTR